MEREDIKRLAADLADEMTIPGITVRLNNGPEWFMPEDVAVKLIQRMAADQPVKVGQFLSELLGVAAKRHQ